MINDIEVYTSHVTDKKEVMHVAVIGSGSGAFASSIKMAELGARVTMIEGAEVVGGSCVNTGCVPSKILIRAAQLAHQQRDNPFKGLKNSHPQVNRSLIAQQQTSLVDELRDTKYISILESNPAITLLKGYAHFENENTLLIKKPDGSEKELRVDRILIATGSTPTIPPINGLADTPYWTSTEALFAEELPESLLVIGSSVIALEIAQAYHRLGCSVTILARHTLLYAEEPLLGERLTECFEREGIRVLNNTQASSVSYDGKTFSLDTNEGVLSADRLLIATGRHANTAQLRLENVGVETQKNGAVIVNDKMETSTANIYAVGDCSNMPQYVYVAAAAGTKAGINMMGGDARLDLSTMPAVIFTDPQVATVGLTEAQAIAVGFEVISRVLDMENVPRALVNFETDGFIKLVADKPTGNILGAQILAHEGGELIQSAALAIHNNMTVDDLAGQLFPYLTMVEGLKLCAQIFSKDIKELSCCAG
ncbi:mercury(II) reductase [Psychrobacter sp. LV10R520-6]|uniref:mercury(II) reductase n=1 Tax=Psychrobacter sp. LV10R520-6 TaxID=1415574 RepID=UPI0024C7AC24|nr:mercury(II) reductase [Psychrobacter sp. LV10R520-6]SNT69820.1 mercuric reductase [Psychrobacter sp. LV10R520-6]